MLEETKAFAAIMAGWFFPFAAAALITNLSNGVDWVVTLGSGLVGFLAVVALRTIKAK